MITFTAPLLDPMTGTTRDITIEVRPGLVLARLGTGRRRGEDGPHHPCADFTSQSVELAGAIVDANEEQEGTERP